MKHVVKGLNLLICGLHLSVSLSKDPRRSTFLFLQCVYFLLILFYLILSCRMYARFLACPLSLEVYSQSPRSSICGLQLSSLPCPSAKYTSVNSEQHGKVKQGKSGWPVLWIMIKHLHKAKRHGFGHFVGTGKTRRLCYPTDRPTNQSPIKS